MPRSSEWIVSPGAGFGLFFACTPLRFEHHFGPLVDHQPHFGSFFRYFLYLSLRSPVVITDIYWKKKSSAQMW
jgi:hypothetical protein